MGVAGYWLAGGAAATASDDEAAVRPLGSRRFQQGLLPAIS